MPAVGLLGAILVQIHHDFDQTRFIAPTPQTAKSYGAFVGTQFRQPNVVEPASRGQGVGHLLLDQMLDALTKRGAPRVLLSTAAKNERAQRLFARAGFRQTMIEMTRESDSNTH